MWACAAADALPQVKNMLLLISRYGLWSVWHAQGTVSRGFCLVLLATSLYCFFSAMRVVIRLRSLRSTDPAQQFAHIEMFFAGLHAVIANVRQVTVATFYLFGFVLFWNLQTIGDFADHTKSSMGFHILEDFIFQCFLAASAFFVFLVLHLTQWLVSSRVNACERRVKAS
jgi:hypothetical protein